MTGPSRSPSLYQLDDAVDEVERIHMLGTYRGPLTGAHQERGIPLGEGLVDPAQQSAVSAGGDAELVQRTGAVAEFEVAGDVQPSVSGPQTFFASVLTAGAARGSGFCAKGAGGAVRAGAAGCGVVAAGAAGADAMAGAGAGAGAVAGVGAGAGAGAGARSRSGSSGSGVGRGGDGLVDA